MKKYKVLIVDDDAHTRDMYSEVFQNNGFEVLEAADGVAGLDMATLKNPDVIFTGIIMPRMDGFGLMEALKKNISTSTIPVFISSHMGREDDKARAFELGAKDFIVRDMTPPIKVIEIINSYFSQGHEYRIEFDTTTKDGKRLMKRLTSKEEELCPKCGGKLILKLILKRGRDKSFNASMVCPKCDS